MQNIGRTTTGLALLVVAVVVLTMGLPAMVLGGSGDGPSIIKVGGLINMNAPGDRVYIDGPNEVHFHLVQLPELREGYLLVQLYVDATNDEKESVGHPRNKPLFKPASAVQMPAPHLDHLPTCYVSRDGVWIPYKYSSNGGDSFTELVDGQWAGVVGR